MIPLPEKSLKTSGKRKSKYGNRPVDADGMHFDSELEYRYYRNLKLLEKAGQVHGVEHHRPFPLLAQNGQLIGVYECDFAFWDSKEDRFRVIDCKGFDTALSKWKRKHVKAQYGFDVEIVRKTS